MSLSTIDENGQPHASYAPFVRDNPGNFYVYVSELSRHTPNLLLTSRSSAIRPQSASILLIEDEGTSTQIYARKRIGFQCQVRQVYSAQPLHQEILSFFCDRHGKVIDLLTSLPDFLLFQLQPASGTFVKGFGQAYRVNAELTKAESIGPENPDF